MWPGMSTLLPVHHDSKKCRCLPCLAFCELCDIRMRFFLQTVAVYRHGGLNMAEVTVHLHWRNSLRFARATTGWADLPRESIWSDAAGRDMCWAIVFNAFSAECGCSTAGLGEKWKFLDKISARRNTAHTWQTLIQVFLWWICVKSNMKCNRGCWHWTAGMSTSLGQILEQTTAKVSKDPELMRAIVSKLCKIPEWSNLRQEPRHGACRMAQRVARARFEVKKWTVPPHMPDPRRTQITFDWRCLENRWGEARFPGFLRPFPRPWWPSTDLPWPQCGAEVLPMASLHRKLDEVNVACDTWPTWQMWQNIRQTWGATDMAAKSQVQDPSPVCFFVSEKSGLESVSSLHTSRLYLVLLEPETSVDKWLFQLDDSKSLHGKWLFKQTSRHPFKTGGSGFQEGIISQFHQISSNILKWSLLYSMCISVKVVYMHSFTIQISPISIDLSCRYSFESTLAQKHPVTVLREWKWLLEETSTHSVPWMQRTRLKQPGSDHPIVQPIY